MWRHVNAGVWLHRMLGPYLTSRPLGLKLLKRIRQEPEVLSALKATQESERKWEAGETDQLTTLNTARSLEQARKVFARVGASGRGALPAPLTVKGGAEA